MVAWLILSSFAGIIVVLLMRKDGDEISDSAYLSFILSDIGLLPGGKNYREILEASLQRRAGRKMVKAPEKEVRVSVSLGGGSHTAQACGP